MRSRRVSVHAAALAASAVLAASAILAACEGPAGPAGTANVISGSVTLSEADWSSGTVQMTYLAANRTTYFSPPARYSDVAVPELTADVVNDGAVLLYLTPNINLPTEFVPLPYRFRWINAEPAYYRVHDGRVTEGSIRFLFFYEPLDADVIPPSPLDVAQPDRIYRWVILPPAAASVTSGLSLAAGPDSVLAELEAQGFTVERRTN